MKSVKTLKLITSGFLLSASMCFVAPLHAAPQPKSTPTAQEKSPVGVSVPGNPGVLPKNYQTMIRGYFSMPGQLLDPYSAVYRFESPHKGSVKDGVFVGGKVHYGWIVPVWINAKNSFGGYAGAKLYFVMFFAEDGNVGDVTEMINGGRGKFVP
jgi:hypothetical protein